MVERGRWSPHQRPVLYLGSFSAFVIVAGVKWCPSFPASFSTNRAESL
jgi:hypothetical protein